jgi:uncharacterized protein YwgA
MNKEKVLKESRDLMLKLHKLMIDHEREVHEGIHGKLSATEFLNLLLEDEDFAWLRKFSMLIVEIDEMFASKEGFGEDMVDALTVKVRELVEMKEPDEYFRAKYQYALQRDPNATIVHRDLKAVIFQEASAN